MASSVSRHSREKPHYCCASHAQTAFEKNLKELVRDHLHSCIVLSCCSDSDASEFASGTHFSREGSQHNAADCWASDEDKNDRSVSSRGRFNLGEESCVESATSRRQARILDRWAARQAREMITTIERQSRQAELMALSSSQSVLARASSFLRETSPARSECSTVDIPNLRASSLVQMWKELEAKATLTMPNWSNGGSSRRICRTNRAASNNDSAFMQDEPSGGSEVCEQDEGYWVDETSPLVLEEDVCGDWESDLAVPSEPNSSQEHTSDRREGERVRVADIIRRLTLENRTQGSTVVWGDRVRARELPIQLERAGFNRENSQRAGSESQEESVYSDQSESTRPPISGNLPRIRGRQATMDVLTRIGSERQTELARLVEHRAVSRFSHRKRIQSLLRLRCLQNEVAAQNRSPLASTASGGDFLQRETPILKIRERFSPRVRQDANGAQTSISHAQSPDLVHSGMARLPSNVSSNYVEMALTNHGIMLADNSLPSTTNERLHEEVVVVKDEESGESLDRAWQERDFLISNDPSWHCTMSNANLPEWEGEDLVVTEEPETCAIDTLHRHVEERDERTDRSMLPTSFRPQQRDWEQGIYHNWLGNNSDNSELRELLERRSVSNFLTSEFRETMDQLILSYLQRRGHQIIGESIEEEMDEQHVVPQQHDSILDINQVAPTSVQLPLPSRFHHSPQLSREIELIYDLRGEMTRLHHEMSELRKMVESCMVMHVELQRSIKQELSTALYRSGGAGETTQCSKWEPMKKGSCCICYGMQVDSLLYRCGHMCTCFKCAHELQWSSGRCPICRAPIMDVVRVYSDS